MDHNQTNWLINLTGLVRKAAPGWSRVEKYYKCTFDVHDKNCDHDKLVKPQSLYIDDQVIAYMYPRVCIRP